MTRRHLTWAYLGNKAGPTAELVQEALDHPELTFSFADSEDRARVRRQIEDALRKSAKDRQLIEIAALLDVRL
jgi:hypothetical protein